MNQPQDAQARAQALDVTQSYIVQAPAGSGKTELLTQRFLALLAHTPKEPEEVVAITFTKKAAAEMRERIIGALESAHAAMPTEAHKQTTWRLAKKVLKRDQQSAWQLQQTPHRLRILTIDALSMHINRFAPLLSELGVQPYIKEDAHELYREAAISLLTQSNQSHIKQAIDTTLLHLDNRADYLIELLSYMLSKREQWLSHIMQANSDSSALRDYLEQSLQNVAQDALTSLDTALNSVDRNMLLSAAQQAGKTLQETDPDNPLAILADLNNNTSFQLAFLPVWQALSNLLLTSQGQWRKSLTKRQGCPPKSANKSRMQEILSQFIEHSKLQAALQGLTACPSLHYRPSQWSIIESLLNILPILVANLRVIMQSQGCVDFTEITLAALRALGDNDNPTDLALYFDYQISHLLIDEFQDTSAIQFRLFEKLISGWQVHEGRTVFLVGDPMQSIYRFRNAEVSLFLQAKRFGIADIPLQFLQLNVNFRSTQGVVNWVNDCFKTLMPPDSQLASGAIEYSPAIAQDTSQEGRVCYYASTSGREHTAQAAVTAIQNIDPSESVAILVRSRTQLKHIIACLHQQRIPFNALDIDPLAACSEIQDCYALTRALLHRQDRIAWFSLLRSPVCGLTLDDLLYIHQATQTTLYATLTNAATLAGLPADSQARLSHFLAAMQPAMDNWGRMPASLAIEQTWQALGFGHVLFNEQAVANCQAYFDLLMQLEQQNSRIILADLQRQIAKLYASNVNADAQVQVMTIHKSKGLEFDHVFLPQLEQKPAQSDTSIMLWLERPTFSGQLDLLLAPIKAYGEPSDNIYTYLQQTEKQKLDLEATRLLYVACTRAKKSLHLMGNFQLDDKDPLTVKPPIKGSHLHRLWPCTQVSFLSQLKLTDSTTHTSEGIAPPQPSLYRLSNSLLQKAVSGSQTKHYPSVAAFSIDNTDSTAKVVGTIIHRALQTIAQITLDTFEQAPLSAHRESWARQLRQDNIESDVLLNKIELAITNTLACPKGRWLLGNNHEFCASEYAISVRQQHGINHWVLDRFIINQDTAWIIDFKTSEPKQLPPDRFIAQEIAQYREQLQNYYHGIAQTYDQPIKCVLYFPLCRPRWVELDLTDQPAPLLA